MVPVKTISKAAAMLALGAGAAFGQVTATSEPVGYTTITVRGKTGAANPNSFFSLSLTRPETWRGVASDIFTDEQGRSVLTISASLGDGALTLSGGGQAHYLQVLDGPNAGTVTEVVVNLGDRVTLADDLSEIIIPSSTMVRLVPHWTMSTAFPGGAGLGGGTSPTAADTVTLYPPYGGAISMFYNTSAGKWRRGLTDASSTNIPPGCGVMVTRKQAGDVQIPLSGVVTTTPVELQVGQGGGTGKITLLPNPHPIASVTLASSGLYTGDPSTGVVGGSSPSGADTVTIYNPLTGAGANYYYSTTANQWRRGLSNASSVTIPEGAAVLINRKAGRGGFSWHLSPPPMGLD